MSKSIYSKGFIYEGVDDAVAAWNSTSYYSGKFSVLNSHNFKEGEDVTGKYRKQHQEKTGHGDFWRDIDEEYYNLPFGNDTRIVALLLNVSVQELAKEWWESLHTDIKSHYENPTPDKIEKWYLLEYPSPAPTQQGEISAMRELIEEMDKIRKGLKIAGQWKESDAEYLYKVVHEKATSLLAKEREQRDAEYRAGLAKGLELRRKFPVNNSQSKP